MKVIFLGLLFLNIVFFLWEHNMRSSGGDEPAKRVNQTGAGVETILLAEESPPPKTRAVDQIETSPGMPDESVSKEPDGNEQEDIVPEQDGEEMQDAAVTESINMIEPVENDMAAELEEPGENRLLPAPEPEQLETPTDQASGSPMDADTAE